MSEMRSFGFLTGVEQSIEFDGPLTDDEWDRIVARAREIFQKKGVLSYDGRVREWTNFQLQIRTEPTQQGHRLRVQSVPRDVPARLNWAIATMGAVVLALVIAAQAGTISNTQVQVWLGIAGVVVLGTFIYYALRLPEWVRRRNAQIGTVMGPLVEAAVVGSAQENR